MTELAINERSPVALLFDEIVGYPKGYRVLTNACSTPFQWSAAIGLEQTTSKRDLVVAQKDRSTDEVDRHPPEMVWSGPILENVLDGAAIDVTGFPAPKWNEKDGG